ncbi:DUF397 domain-containing protein [Streptomyces endophyticus]|uniref:DUF397 domain-containing protein n=1 Tax=Streptomyces endophyticus TaxID=714166 RepID=A0ABU6FF44_9ACTN|nr:DUF397 domain-containing protein [Streptomyces endophyticus]MEB8342614.1 DUF397 domain-containing protein [Streptomyces endophyticus]
MSTDLDWFKSSYSGGQGECLEVAPGPTTIHIRDSKQPHTPDPGPAVTVTAPAWAAFLSALR